jgi:hypothetical protein
MNMALVENYGLVFLCKLPPPLNHVNPTPPRPPTLRPSPPLL